MSVAVVETSAPVVKVGDFFSSSWGYDQTNVDFYKVVGMTASGKSVKVQKWSSKCVESSGMGQDYVVPGDSPATYTDWSAVDHNADYWVQKEQKVTRDMPVETKRIRYWGSTASFSVDHTSASKWDGKPEYATSSGWGH